MASLRATTTCLARGRASGARCCEIGNSVHRLEATSTCPSFAASGPRWSLMPRGRGISTDSSAASEVRRSPFGNHVTGLQGAVVVPLPGMLLTKELFEAARLEDAFAGYASGVDADLGAEAILSATSTREAAAAVITGLERRHNGAMGVLIGHSYGGYVALEIARQAPQWVAGLVLMSTQNRADTPGAASRRRQQIALAHSDGIPSVMDGLMPALLSPKARKDDAVVEMVRRMAERTGLFHFERQMHGCIERRCQRNTVRQLDPRIPVLIISGAKDKLIPTVCARELASELKARDASAPWAARTHHESGHLLALEQPEALHNYLNSWAKDVHEHAFSSSMRQRFWQSLQKPCDGQFPKVP